MSLHQDQPPFLMSSECQGSSNGPPEYWDVSYRFRNVEHRIQMTSPPGRPIVVNRDGEPRQ